VTLQFCFQALSQQWQNQLRQKKCSGVITSSFYQLFPQWGQYGAALLKVLYLLELGLQGLM